GLGRTQRGVLVQTDRDRAEAAEDLHPDVVPGGVVPRTAHGDEGVVVEGEQGGGRVDIAVVAEEGLTAVRAGGEDADDLAAGEVPDDVEVVHGAVAEEAATGRDVLL